MGFGGGVGQVEPVGTVIVIVDVPEPHPGGAGLIGFPSGPTHGFGGGGGGGGVGHDEGGKVIVVGGELPPETVTVVVEVPAGGQVLPPFVGPTGVEPPADQAAHVDVSRRASGFASTMKLEELAKDTIRCVNILET